MTTTTDFECAPESAKAVLRAAIGSEGYLLVELFASTLQGLERHDAISTEGRERLLEGLADELLCHGVAKHIGSSDGDPLPSE